LGPLSFRLFNQRTSDPQLRSLWPDCRPAL